MSITRSPKIQIRDEGTPQGSVNKVDFVGAGVTAAVAAGVATVTIPGGSGANLPFWPTVWSAYDNVDTVDSDPGAGKFKTNNSNPQGVTEIYMSTVDANGSTVTNVVNFFWVPRGFSGQQFEPFILSPATIPIVEYGLYSLSRVVNTGLGYFRITVANSGSPTTALVDGTNYAFFKQVYLSPRELEINLGSVPRHGGRVRITSVAHGFSSTNIYTTQLTGPYTGKGTLLDECEVDMIHVIGASVDVDTIDFYWTSDHKVRGNFKISIQGV